jgi:hypothetical protein
MLYPNSFIWHVSINLGCDDCGAMPLYGLASDDLVFIFVTISHEGVLKLARRFDVLVGDSTCVLGLPLEVRPGKNSEHVSELDTGKEQAAARGKAISMKPHTQMT